MRMRFAAAGLAVVAAFGGGTAFANHTPGYQPSQHCDGTTPGDPFSPGTNKVPVKTKIDLARPGVCFNLGNGGFKGAVWADLTTNSVVIDGDSTNSNTSRCFDGYAGVRLSPDAHLLFSQGTNYNPAAGESDGGTTGNGAGSANDRFDPTTENGELQSCFVG